MDQCTDAYELISRTIIRHHKSRKLAWFHRVERDTGPDEHSVAINGIVFLIDLFKHKCGVVVECPKGSPFWPDHRASHFIDKGFVALGYDWSNHCSTVTSHKFQPSMYLLVDPVVQTAVGPDCAYIGSYPLLQCWFGKHTSVWVVVGLVISPLSSLPLWPQPMAQWIPPGAKPTLRVALLPRWLIDRRRRIGTYIRRRVVREGTTESRVRIYRMTSPPVEAGTARSACE